MSPSNSANMGPGATSSGDGAGSSRGSNVGYPSMAAMWAEASHVDNGGTVGSGLDSGLSHQAQQPFFVFSVEL